MTFNVAQLCFVLIFGLIIFQDLSDVDPSDRMALPASMTFVFLAGLALALTRIHKKTMGLSLVIPSSFVLLVLFHQWLIAPGILGVDFFYVQG